MFFCFVWFLLLTNDGIEEKVRTESERASEKERERLWRIYMAVYNGLLLSVELMKLQRLIMSSALSNTHTRQKYGISLKYPITKLAKVQQYLHPCLSLSLFVLSASVLSPADEDVLYPPTITSTFILLAGNFIQTD